ncbi:MAG: hypothetical protein COZ18_16215 [Flexibacter sp. CG_4_10_14_3_um_filter_32_15]|nr:MAG: hypothetical protein COZ18_16215 [Flexibacter sp. CG_4_10_14_3_um_filter_32_15]
MSDSCNSTNLLKSISNTNNNERVVDPNGTIIIPVVFHLLYDGNEPPLFLNPTDARVQTQIAILNEDFRRTNLDKVNTPLPFQGVVADVNIEFKLACIDPNGSPTTGITRRNVGNRVFREAYTGGVRDEFATGIKYTSQGGQDAWATDKYLNIWVVSRMETFKDGRWQDLLGYGTFPDKYIDNPNTDGVAILASRMGRGLGASASGRTATHEVGHWLGLFHTWGRAGSCVDGNDGDYVSDTPVQANPSAGSGICPSFPRVSCPNSGTNGDMFMNFMDYSPDFCMNLFTNGQKVRMRAVFFSGQFGYRANFINNYFKIKGIDITTCQNNTITVKLQNVHCLPVSWVVNGGTKVSENSQGVTITGNGNVTVTAKSGNYTDTKTFYLGTNITTSDIGRQFCKTYYYEFQNYVEFTGNGFAPLNANFEVEKSINSVNFGYYVVQNKIYIQPHTTGIISFRVRVMGYCGWSAWKLFQYDVVNCGSGGGFFRAYPNPTKDSFTLDFEPEDENQKRILTDDLKIELYNSYQKLVFETVLKKEEKEKKLKIDVNRFPHGVYYLKVIDDKKVYTERILIGK